MSREYFCDKCAKRLKNNYWFTLKEGISEYDLCNDCHNQFRT